MSHTEDLLKKSSENKRDFTQWSPIPLGVGEDIRKTESGVLLRNREPEDLDTSKNPAYDAAGKAAGKAVQIMRSKQIMRSNMTI